MAGGWPAFVVWNRTQIFHRQYGGDVLDAASLDFNRRLLTVEGRNAKNRETPHVPLNDEAVGVLRR